MKEKDVLNLLRKIIEDALFSNVFDEPVLIALRDAVNNQINESEVEST